MIVYFSRSGGTRKYASMLAQMTGQAKFELEPEKLVGGFLACALKSVFTKEEKVKALPDLTGEETIYLCSPVWAGKVPPTMRYLIHHGALSGKTVHFLLTCMSPGDEGYAKSTEALLREAGAVPGKHMIVSMKKNPEPEREVLLGLL